MNQRMKRLTREVETRREEIKKGRLSNMNKERKVHVENKVHRKFKTWRNEECLAKEGE